MKQCTGYPARGIGEPCPLVFGGPQRAAGVNVLEEGESCLGDFDDSHRRTLANVNEPGPSVQAGLNIAVRKTAGQWCTIWIAET
jgi:hypothetical protein